MIAIIYFEPPVLCFTVLVSLCSVSVKNWGIKQEIQDYTGTSCKHRKAQLKFKTYFDYKSNLYHFSTYSRHDELSTQILDFCFNLTADFELMGVQLDLFQVSQQILFA